MAAIVENQDGIDISTIVGITREALANNPPFLRRAQSLFLRIDINSDGLLTKNELEALVGTDKAEFMMNDLDVDHNNQVDPAEWNTYWVKCKSAGINVDARLNWIEKQVVLLETGRAASLKKKALRCASATDIPDIMRRATSIFLDIDQDQKGRLTREDLFKVLGTTERVTPALKELDSDNDGYVSVAEFCQWSIRMYVDHDKTFAKDHLDYLETWGIARTQQNSEIQGQLGESKTSSTLGSLKAASATAIPEILQRASSAFLRIDANNNGVLDGDEIKRYCQNNKGNALTLYLETNKKVSAMEFQKFFITMYNTSGGEATLTALTLIESSLLLR